MSDPVPASPRPIGKEFSDFLAAPVPRPVPERFKKVIARHNGGWIALLLPLVFAAVFACLGFIQAPPWLVLADQRLSEATPFEEYGTIVEATRLYSKGHHLTGSRYSVEYDLHGHSKVDSFYRGGEDWTEGQKVQMAADSKDPSLLCPIGARHCEGGLIELLGFGVGVPLFVLLILYSNVRTRHNDLRLLSEGEIVEMTVLTAWKPLFRSRGVVGKMTYSVPGDTRTVNVTNRRIYERACDLAGTPQTAFVLQDPRRPKKVVFAEWLLDDGV